MKLVCAVALLAACGRGGDAPSCAAVASNFALIATKELDATSQDAEAQRAVRAQLPAMRDALDHACSDSAWSAAVRTCLQAAATGQAFQACEAQLTEGQRRELDRLESGEKSDR